MYTSEGKLSQKKNVPMGTLSNNINELTNAILSEVFAFFIPVSCFPALIVHHVLSAL